MSVEQSPACVMVVSVPTQQAATCAHVRVVSWQAQMDPAALVRCSIALTTTDVERGHTETQNSHHDSYLEIISEGHIVHAIAVRCCFSCAVLSCAAMVWPGHRFWCSPPWLLCTRAFPISESQRITWAADVLVLKAFHRGLLRNTKRTEVEGVWLG